MVIWMNVELGLTDQLEQQKLFNLITNFMQIGPSKAKICSNL